MRLATAKRCLESLVCLLLLLIVPRAGSRSVAQHGDLFRGRSSSPEESRAPLPVPPLGAVAFREDVRRRCRIELRRPEVFSRPGIVDRGFGSLREVRVTAAGGKAGLLDGERLLERLLRSQALPSPPYPSILPFLPEPIRFSPSPLKNRSADATSPFPPPCSLRVQRTSRICCGLWRRGGAPWGTPGASRGGCGLKGRSPPKCCIFAVHQHILS